MDLGETPRALTGLNADGDVDPSADRAVPSRLSPYLRFGVVSPRQAYHLGVRKRHLLWRDWSHLCWRYSDSLRHGAAVVAVLDGCTRRVPVSPPCAPGALARAARPVWADGDEAAFAAWATGTTGARVVDAAMRQLWATGWMSRRARLLCASCLVEGMSGDWRRGRDWCVRPWLRRLHAECERCGGSTLVLICCHWVVG
jgi:deoxyribodipyrimidine photo-lyase